MSVLSVIDPPDCDGLGVPLDWECCRTCKGTGKAYGSWTDGRRAETPDRCPTCGGWGSLKAAVLAELTDRLRRDWVSAELRRAGWSFDGERLPTDKTTALDQIEASLRDHNEVAERADASFVFRCEDCWHPMSWGTWEENGRFGPVTREGYYAEALRSVEHAARAGRDIEQYVAALAADHYTLCDERCEHEGPGRVDGRVIAPPPVGLDGVPGHGRADICQRRDSEGNPMGLLFVLNGNRVEASWRPVDVRTLGWPHDLRPGKLAVLCLRCWAERGRA